MLVDPETGHLAAVSQAAVSANEAEEEVAEELFLQQIETSTNPASTPTSCSPGCAQDAEPSARQRPRPGSARWPWLRPC